MRLFVVLAGLLTWSLVTADTTIPSDTASTGSLSQDSQFSELALQPADIRLLIDVSGSMRRTDPNNLRRPALSLLVRLLPPGSEAGVWAFGQEVEPLVPLGPADSEWKQLALERMSQIDSRALYTNTGAALERATPDREERLKSALPQNDRPIDIILLTDGMVDVSPDQQVNAREQARILNELVPNLSSAGYRIHTLALSDEADEPLLRAMARASDGIFSRARNADDLMDSLLGIFQQMVPGQRLPIDEGRFLVDDSIEEFTVLVRREPDQAPARLRGPNGQQYRHTESHPNLNWYHTDRYDLITMVDPLPGVWELQAELQPHSRLTVISDLQLLVQPLPNNLVVGQPLELEFALNDRHGRIDDPELLSVLTLEAQFAGPEVREQKRRRWQGGPPADGRYRMTLPAPREPGEYRLELQLDGKTFKRFFSHRIAVSSVFAVELLKQKEDERVHWDLRVEATTPLDEEASSVVAHVRNSKGYTRLHTLSQDSPDVWHLRVTPEESANYRIGLQASGRLRNGAVFDEELPPQYFSFPEEGDLPILPIDTALEDLKTGLADQHEAAERARLGADSEPNTLPLGLAKPAKEVAETSEFDGPAQEGLVNHKESNEAIHPAFLYGSLAFANGLLLVLAYFSYRLIMGANRRSPEAPEEEISDVPGAPPPMQQIASDSENNKAKAPEPEIPETPVEEASAPSQAERPEDQLYQDESEDEFAEEPLFPLPGGDTGQDEK